MSNHDDDDEGRVTDRLTLERGHLVSQRTINWTSRKTPGSSVGDALQANVKPLSPQVHKGIHVHKVTSYGQMRNRVLTVSNDYYAVFVTHTKVSSNKGVISTVASTLKTPLMTRKGWSQRDRYVRYIDVADIDYVQPGVVGTYKLEYTRKSKDRLKGKDGKVDEQSEYIVSIIHHGDQTLDVIVKDKKEKDALVACIKDMVKTYREAQENVGNEELLLRYIWYDIDATNDGAIQQAEFIKLTNRINLPVKNPAKVYKKYLDELQSKETQGKKDGLSYHESMCLLQRIKSGYYKKTAATTLPSMDLWDSIFGPDTTHVSSEDFLSKFLVQHQGETDANQSAAEELLSRVNEWELNREGDEIKLNHMCKIRFEAYLKSDINAAYDPKAQVVNRESLNEPISHYWIDTSHNTYLLGDQLQSTSSVGMYMEALHRGCKCLELDCWDGEKDANEVAVPIVFHGHTLTSKIIFADIIRGVKNYVDSHPDTYPIILSLENHCSHPFQEIMAKLLSDILGDLLYIPFANGKKAKDAEHDVLPSPASLRGKVVIKGKRPPELDEGEDEATEAEEEDFDPYDDAAGASPTSSKSGGDKPKHKIVKELARMTLFHGTKFKSFDQSIALPTSHMHSIGETKITKILNKDKANADAWRQYNVRHMTRTYPAGTRVDSSNYNPIVAWSMGCQLVALNFQTSDVPLLLNDGRFRQNGRCGYVLKPASVMGTDRPTSEPTNVSIKVLSGSCLPKPQGAKGGETIDPYVQVVMHDTVVDAETGIEKYASDSFQTSVVNDNGFCPIWGEASGEPDYKFEVHNMDVAMIQFSLWESDYDLDDKVADATIPMSCLRKGVRSIRLYHPKGTRTGPFGFATLLVEIDF